MQPAYGNPSAGCFVKWAYLTPAAYFADSGNLYNLVTTLLSMDVRRPITQPSTWLIYTSRVSTLMAACCLSLFSAQWNPFSAAHDRQVIRETLLQIDQQLGLLPELRVSSQTHQRIGFYALKGTPAWITLDLGRNVQPDEIILWAARSSDTLPEGPANGFPPQVRCLISETGNPDSYELIHAWQEESLGRGNDLPFLRLPGNGFSGRYLRIEIIGARDGERQQFFSLGEIMVLEAGINRALGTPVESSRSTENPPRWARGNLTDGFVWCGMLSGMTRSAMNGFHSAIVKNPQAVPKWVEVDLGSTVSIDEIRLVPARPADFADVAGFGFPPTFQVIAFADDQNSTPIILYDTKERIYTNPGDATVCIPAEGIPARRIRIVATALWERSSDYIFALAELQVMAARENIALNKKVTASDKVQLGIWASQALVDGFSSQYQLLDWSSWLDAATQRLQLEQQRRSLRTQLIVAEDVYQQTLIRSSLFVIFILLTLGAGTLVGLHWHQRILRERMRQRIAQDLHDDLGSQLSHVALLAELGETEVAVPEQASASFKKIAQESRDLQHALRDLVWLLEPRSGEAEAFAVRLRTICQRLLTPIAPITKIDVTGQAPKLTLPIAWSRDVLLFIKEALNNCGRHSQAQTVLISLTWSSSQFSFVLQDDGVGFDENQPDFNAGAGLRNLRNRSQALNASLKLTSTKGAGTRIEFNVPLPKRIWWRHLLRI